MPNIITSIMALPEQRKPESHIPKIYLPCFIKLYVKPLLSVKSALYSISLARWSEFIAADDEAPVSTPTKKQTATIIKTICHLLVFLFFIKQPPRPIYLLKYMPQVAAVFFIVLFFL